MDIILQRHILQLLPDGHFFDKEINSVMLLVDSSLLRLNNFILVHYEVYKVFYINLP